MQTFTVTEIVTIIAGLSAFITAILQPIFAYRLKAIEAQNKETVASVAKVEVKVDDVHKQGNSTLSELKAELANQRSENASMVRRLAEKQADFVRVTSPPAALLQPAPPTPPSPLPATVGPIDVAIVSIPK